MSTVRRAVAAGGWGVSSGVSSGVMLSLLLSLQANVVNRSIKRGMSLCMRGKKLLMGNGVGNDHKFVVACYIPSCPITM